MWTQKNHARGFVRVSLALATGALLAASCTSTPDRQEVALDKESTTESTQSPAQRSDTTAVTTSTTHSTNAASTADQAPTAEVRPNTAEAPSSNPVDIVIGSGATTPLAVGPTTIELTTSASMAGPFLLQFYSLWQPTDGVWGLVAVHNLERDISSAEPFTDLIDGHRAVLLRFPDAPAEHPASIVVQVGPWWIDIAVEANSPEEQRQRQREFLSSLSITEVAGDFPQITDGNGWMTSLQDLILITPTSGFGIEISPNCDPGTEEHCVPGVGRISPAESTWFGLVGEQSILHQPSQGLRPPDDLRIVITGLGPVGELVTCDGSPAFEHHLLSRDLTLWQATQEVEVYTGITEWDRRFQPGVETWFIGDPERPDVVSTYVRNNQGNWDAESVLTCQ